MATASVEIERRAQTALSNSPIYALREVRVQQTRAGNLLLSGRVDSFYHKQLAQECVRAVADGYPVVNALAVD